MADWKALGGGLTDALGRVAGNKVNELLKPGMDAAANAAGNAAQAAARMGAIALLPDKLDLAKSPKLEFYVEKALTSMGIKGIQVDGKPDAKTLTELNKVLVAQGRPELASLSDFAKDDLKALNKALEDAKGPDGKPNVAAQNVLNTGAQVFADAKADFPKPKEDKKPAPQNDPALTGG